MKPFLFLLIILSMSYNLYSQSKHDCSKDPDILGNLSNVQRAETVYWWTLHCGPMDDACNEYHELLVEEISREMPQLAKELEL